MIKVGRREKKNHHLRENVQRETQTRQKKQKKQSFIGVNGSLLLHELVIEGLESPLQGIFIQSLKT